MLENLPRATYAADNLCSNPCRGKMSKRPMPPSAHDVARLAGVSQAAVSRAFTPGASISKRMRAKVVESAEALGYQPNLLARSLIKGRSEIIGVVIGRPLYSFFMATFGALSAQLSEAGKHILVYTAETDSSGSRYSTMRSGSSPNP